MTKTMEERIAVVETKVDILGNKVDNIDKKMDSIHEDIDALLVKLDGRYATKTTEKIVYSLVGLIVSSVVIAILAQVIKQN